MTEAPIGFAERPPSVAATRGKVKKCACDAKKLEKELATWKQKLQNLEDRIELLDGNKRKQQVWTYKCMTPGCGQLIEVGPPETRVGHTMKCSVHGVVPLDLVSPRPA